jgi:hypothetical protein
MTDESSIDTPLHGVMPEQTNSLPGTYVCHQFMPGDSRTDFLTLAGDGTYQYKSTDQAGGMAPWIEQPPAHVTTNSGHWSLVSPAHVDLTAEDGSIFMFLMSLGDRLVQTDGTNVPAPQRPSDGRLVFTRTGPPVMGEEPAAQ